MCNTGKYTSVLHEMGHVFQGAKIVANGIVYAVQLYTNALNGLVHTV